MVGGADKKLKEKKVKREAAEPAGGCCSTEVIDLSLESNSEAC